MTEPRRSGDNPDQTRAQADRAPAGMPRWVKLFGVVAAFAIVLVVALLLTGNHGPSRHRGFEMHIPGGVPA